MFGILKKSEQTKVPIFATGTGRCGTHLLQSLFEQVGVFSAHHIQDLIGDSFYRYCAWNHLNVDTGGLIDQRREWIKEASKIKKVYFESNPYLSFSIHTLRNAFQAKFIFIIRNPEDVVKSHIIKGWYDTSPVIDDINKAIGYQYGMQPNHFLGRLVPQGAEFTRWNQLSRVGKLAWMWNTVNMKIADQLKTIAATDHFLIKLEDLDYPHFTDLLKFCGVAESMDGATFYQLKNTRPGKGKTQKLSKWNSQEWNEFYQETEEGRKYFNYELTQA